MNLSMFSSPFTYFDTCHHVNVLVAITTCNAFSLYTSICVKKMALVHKQVSLKELLCNGHVRIRFSEVALCYLKKFCKSQDRKTKTQHGSFYEGIKKIYMGNRREYIPYPLHISHMDRMAAAYVKTVNEKSNCVCTTVATMRSDDTQTFKEQFLHDNDQRINPVAYIEYDRPHQVTKYCSRPFGGFTDPKDETQRNEYGIIHRWDY